MPGTNLRLVANSVAAILSRVCAAIFPRRHGVIVFLWILVASVATAPLCAGFGMVHRRSAIGKWKRAWRNWERGFGPCPCPPPAPPPICGVEDFTGGAELFFIGDSDEDVPAMESVCLLRTPLS